MPQEPGMFGGPPIINDASRQFVGWVSLTSLLYLQSAMRVDVDTLHQPRNTATINYKCLSVLVVQWVLTSHGGVYIRFSSESDCTTVSRLTSQYYAMWSSEDHVITSQGPPSPYLRLLFPICDVLTTYLALEVEWTHTVLQNNEALWKGQVWSHGLYPREAKVLRMYSLCSHSSRTVARRSLSRATAVSIS